MWNLVWGVSFPSPLIQGNLYRPLLAELGAPLICGIYKEEGLAWQGRGRTRATKEKCDPGVNLTVETAGGTPVLQDWSPRSSTVASYLPAAEAHLPVEPSSLRLFSAFFCLCKPLLWPKVHFKRSSLVSPADRIQICFPRTTRLCSTGLWSVTKAFACSESRIYGNQCLSVGLEMTAPQRHACRFYAPLPFSGILIFVTRAQYCI